MKISRLQQLQCHIKNIFTKNLVIKDKLTLYAKSVNLILKINENIFGYNTDIIGALSSIPKKKQLKLLLLDKVVLVKHC